MNTLGRLGGWAILGFVGAFGCASRSPVDAANTHGISSTDTPADRTDTVAAETEPGTYTVLYLQVAGGDSVCTSLDLPPDADGQVDCKVIEMVRADHCDCTAPGRAPASAAQIAAGRRILGGSADPFEEVCGGPGEPACDRYCGCELKQMTGSALESCRQDVDMTSSAAGWCYDNPNAGLGNPGLTASPLGCTSRQDKLLRVQAPGLDATDSLGVPLRATFMECAKKTIRSAPETHGTQVIGAACLPSEQQVADFRMFENSEASIDTASLDCATNLCLVENLAAHATSGPAATTDPYCSCRCDGPAGCACPGGFECKELVHDMGLASSAGVAGSYCVRSGATP